MAANIFIVTSAGEVAKTAEVAPVRIGDFIYDILNNVLYMHVGTNAPAVLASGSAKATNVGALTDNTGGVVSNTLAAITAGAAYAQADMVAVKNALASLSAKVDAIRAAMVAANQMAGP